MDGTLPEMHAPDPAVGMLCVEVQASPTVGHAPIQNAVPVVRSMRLSNGTEDRLISPIDPHPDHDHRSDLQEGMSASITASVVCGTEELAQHTQPIQVLTHGQWAGTRALPGLLAAFSVPHDPAVEILVGKASELLRKPLSELSMDGYQSKSRDLPGSRDALRTMP